MRGRAHRFAWALCPLLLLPSLASAAPPPNFVVLLADDLGYSDLGSYGSEIETPHVDALAAEGVRFGSYHSAGSCAPARAMLLTGVDSHRAGVANMPEALPRAQRGRPGYQGVLSRDVVTVATLLRDAGYHTYMAGKWHLGHGPGELPSRRGFERTVALAETGADNWEQKTYLPLYDEPHWYADGDPLTLPDDFYSSEYYVDKTIEFIESGRRDGKPFFAYVPFQAVHIPVQAPREFIDKYDGVYDAGWTRLRESRRDGAAERGLIPPGVGLVTMSTTEDWGALSAEEKRYQSRRMAVYAGMVDAMDHHIGRLLDYLRDAGLYENTVVIFTSDNGAEAGDPLARLSFRIWLALRAGYGTGYDEVGVKGGYSVIGPSFASAAASPGAFYKMHGGEGGLRVPLVIAGPGVRRGVTTRAFAYVTDLAPTILELAGVPRHRGHHRGRAVEPIQGRSLVPLLAGAVDRIHPADEAIGYELAGDAALFRGDYKLVRNVRPLGDGEWHLHDVQKDPGETRDLRDAMPALHDELQAEYAAWERANGVLPMPEGYDAEWELTRKVFRRIDGAGGAWILVGAGACVALLVWRRRQARS